MAGDHIFVEQLQLGHMANFVYLFGCTQTKEIAIIDPGWEGKLLVKHVEELGYTLTSILLTHGHFDHVSAVPEILNQVNVPVYISENEAPGLIPQIPDINLVADNAQLTVGNLTLDCIHTPGHSPGGMCFLVDTYLFTGDTLFVQGCGRCDLPGSDPDQMFDSLQKRIYPLSDELTVLAGHDYGTRPSAPLGDLKKTNRFLSCKDRDTFMTSRMQ